MLDVYLNKCLYPEDKVILNKSSSPMPTKENFPLKFLNTNPVKFFCH